MEKQPSPPLVFVTGVSHAAAVGNCVVVSLGGFEPSATATEFPITHRFVMERAALVQSIEFLQGWLNGTLKPLDPSQVQ